MNMELYLISFKTRNSKWKNDLSLRPESIKLLNRNIGKNVFDFGLGDYFFIYDTKTQTQKAKLNKQDYMKPKTIYT